MHDPPAREPEQDLPSGGSPSFSHGSGTTTSPVDWRRYDAALFDLDGVLTPTAEVHMRAWSEMFGAYFAAHGIEPAYSDADYFRHVDGRPRRDGVRATLASRGVALPLGDPDDAPDALTVCGLGNAKDAIFRRVLTQEGIAPCPGAVALLDHLAAHRVGVAVVSSSRNAHVVLAAAGLADRFAVVVDGEVAGRERMAGKPSPQTFSHAARALGVDPPRAAVIEDAVPGVQAGRAGGFGLVIGVDRGAGAASLRRAGADVVVQELTELVAP